MKNQIDLSTKSNSFTSYLTPFIATIHKKSYEEIIEILKDSKNHVSISDAYLAQVLSKVHEFRHRKGMVLKYLTDIVLKGSNLGVI